MKRFYYLMAALLLLPVTAFAQPGLTDPLAIDDLCNEDDPDIGFWYGQITFADPILGETEYGTGSLAQGDVVWGDTTTLWPPGVTGSVVIGRDPGANPGDDPDEGCSPLTNGDEVSGNVALIRRGACAFSVKTENALNAGAIGVLIYNDEREDFEDWQVINMSGTSPSAEATTIGAAFLPRAMGNEIVSQIEDFENPVTATIQYPQCYMDLAPIANEDTGVVESREISAAYPNPFTERTQFDLTLEDAQEVSVRVYNVLGQEVAVLHDGLLPAGAQQTFTFESATLPAGVYLYRVVGETFASTRQVTLVR